MKKLYCLLALLLTVFIISSCNFGDTSDSTAADTTTDITSTEESTDADTTAEAESITADTETTATDTTADDTTAVTSEITSDKTTGEITTEEVTTEEKEETTEDTTSAHMYTSFTPAEKKLFEQYIGEVIPFIPNDEYYVEGYYEETDYEHGMNFYAFGNTQVEFDAYLELFESQGYTYTETYEDDYGDTWYCYEKNNDIFIDICYYYYEGYYVIDLYVYSSLSTDIGDEEGDTSETTKPEEDLLTNENAGLPQGTNGVYNVNFKDAEYVPDVTHQGYYINGCPTVGSPAVLVIPVEFSDAPASANAHLTIDKLHSAMNGETNYFSLHEYYYLSSYGQLDLNITVADKWFKPEYDSEYYASATMDYYGDQVLIGDQLILDEALAYYSTFMDLSEFDSDGNGIIDAVIMVNTLEINDESEFNWAYRYWNIYTDENEEYFEYDGVSANDYIWMSYYFIFECYDDDGNVSYDAYDTVQTYTFIHEFAHVLGAGDYYDTSYSGDTDPMNGCDIMASMPGDHNAFTKFNFGWITSSRLVVADDTLTLTLEAFSDTGDTIILANNWDSTLGAYQEYYVIAYYKGTDLNDPAVDGGYFVRDGIVVYHVNSTLFIQDVDGETYYDIYNNNTDPSDEDGTENNLIEYVKSAADTYTYVEGDSLPSVTDDYGDSLGYTFVVEALTDSAATLVFTKI